MEPIYTKQDIIDRLRSVSKKVRSDPNSASFKDDVKDLVIVATYAADQIEALILEVEAAHRQINSVSHFVEDGGDICSNCNHHYRMCTCKC
jgi:hypothetical protein